MGRPFGAWGEAASGWSLQSSVFRMSEGLWRWINHVSDLTSDFLLSLGNPGFCDSRKDAQKIAKRDFKHPGFCLVTTT